MSIALERYCLSYTSPSVAVYRRFLSRSSKGVRIYRHATQEHMNDITAPFYRRLLQEGQDLSNFQSSNCALIARDSF